MLEVIIAFIDSDDFGYKDKLINQINQLTSKNYYLAQHVIINMVLMDQVQFFFKNFLEFFCSYMLLIK